MLASQFDSPGGAFGDGLLVRVDDEPRPDLPRYMPGGIDNPLAADLKAYGTPDPVPPSPFFEIGAADFARIAAAMRAGAPRSADRAA